MKLKFLGFLLLISKLVFSQQLASPEVICTAGAYNVIENSIQVSWTLGEIMTETFSNSTYTYTQGFQQESYSIEIKPEKVDYKDFFTEISYFPNPFQTFFNLKLEFDEAKSFQLVLFSEDGKKILIQKLSKGLNPVYLQAFNSQLIVATIVDEKSTNVFSFRIMKQN